MDTGTGTGTDMVGQVNGAVIAIVRMEIVMPNPKEEGVGEVTMVVS